MMMMMVGQIELNCVPMQNWIVWLWPTMVDRLIKPNPTHTHTHIYIYI